MEILTPGEMAAKFDFVSPMKEEPEERVDMWPISFEYGGLKKGTRISISKAKEISAELRAAVAEAEKKEIKRAFDQERKSLEEANKRSAQHQQDFYDQLRRTNLAEQSLRRLKRSRNR